MRFLDTRNTLMEGCGWDRRVATLAARLILGVDTWDSIASTPSFRGTPLLSIREAQMIRDEIARSK
jgi:hypothetical protein